MSSNFYEFSAFEPMSGPIIDHPLLPIANAVSLFRALLQNRSDTEIKAASTAIREALSSPSIPKFGKSTTEFRALLNISDELWQSHVEGLTEPQEYEFFAVLGLLKSNQIALWTNQTDFESQYLQLEGQERFNESLAQLQELLVMSSKLYKLNIVRMDFGEITDKTFLFATQLASTNRAKQAAQARHKGINEAKQQVIERYRLGPDGSGTPQRVWRSSRDAARIIYHEIVQPLRILAPSNAERTVYEWILDYLKEQNQVV